jgi:glycine/D-amino acid oxidase-like deaminating enzyme/nitrite reductase/ring-hydroxylating ferredoxin subunit
MKIKSVWNEFTTPHNFPQMSDDLTTDVAIIGGGVCGVSVAQELSQRGYNVVVLEAKEVGGGTTAHSTGNIYVTVDKNIDRLLQKHDKQVIKELLHGRAWGCQRIEENVKSFSLDCDYKKVPWHFYSSSPESDDKINRDLEASKQIDLPFSSQPFSAPFPIRNSVSLENQAQLNPRLYTRRLAEKIAGPRCHIFEGAEVHSIEKDNNYYQLATTKHKKIRAKYLVHATHTPKGVKIIQSFLGPYREYGIACKLATDSPSPEGIMWGYHGEENFISSRMYEREGQRYLILVGNPHKVGQNSENELNISALEKHAHEYFKTEEITHRWGGQHYRPADFLPYIGQEESDSSVYMATGFSTDGLVYGSLAAKIIADLIDGKPHPLSEILRPYRHDILKAAPNFIKENINVALQLLKDLPHLGKESFSDIPLDSGAVIEKDGQKIAISRDAKGEVAACSAICTHMKCIVNWNPSEKSWDCPCHGSRFDRKGKVIEGPALHDLHKISREDE